jgi:hypothetical protein
LYRNQNKMTSNTINYGKIKREILKRDSGLDSRFTTKIGKDKKKYDRKREKRRNFENMC